MADVAIMKKKEEEEGIEGGRETGGECWEGKGDSSLNAYQVSRSVQLMTCIRYTLINTWIMIT